MTLPATATATATDRMPETSPSSSADEPELVAEDLIEEVSIDGMCGVY